MANPEHLAILKKGVRDWNEWRKNNPEENPDFSGAILRGFNFQGANFNNANFSNAEIQGTNFTKANLQGANFTKATAGLQWHWQFVLIIVTGLLAVSISAAFTIVLLISGLPLLIIPSPLRRSEGLVIFTVVIILIWVASEVIYYFKISKKGIIARLKYILNIADFFKPLLLISLMTTWGGVLVLLTYGAFLFIGTVFGFVTNFKAWNLSFFIIIIYIVGAVGGFLAGIYIFRHIKAESQQYISNHEIALRIAAIGGTSFYDTDLTDAIFSQANLEYTDFREAIIKRTNWFTANNLNFARVKGTILADSEVRGLLVSRKVKTKYFYRKNFKGAYLVGVDLSKCNFTQADLSEADLKTAILEKVNLTEIKALGTNFREAKLTGASGIGSWHIDNKTILDKTDCKYIYLKHPYQKRCPNDGDFTPEEFAKRFQKAVNTFEIIVRDSNWQTIAQAFIEENNRVSKEYSEELYLKGHEWLGVGLLLLRFSYPLRANGDKIQKRLERRIHQLELEKAILKEKIESKEKEIAKYEYERLFKQPTYQINNIQIGENNEMTKQPNFQQNFNGSVNAVAQNVEGNQNVYAPLSYFREAEEIHEVFLNRISPINATNHQAVEEIVYQEIKSNPTIKAKLVKLVKAAAWEALKAIFNDPRINIPIEIVKAWLEEK